MTKDPIVEELHRQRAEEMERLGFDFEAYYREIKELEKSSAERILPPSGPRAPSPAQRTRSASR